MFNQMLLQIFDAPFIFFIIKLLLAMVLGILLGLERIHAHKTAGMRTYALITVSTAFFISISLYIGQVFGASSGGGFNPGLMAANVITGIGFLGAGLIIFKDGHIENLTTAAGTWVCAGIGMAIGFGMFREAILVSVLTFFVMGILSFVERDIRLRVFPDPEFIKQMEQAEGVQVKKPRKPRVTKAKSL